MASKRNRAISERVDPIKVYKLEEILTVLGEFASKKFTESIDVSIRLGINPTKSDQVVRGAVVMPSGTGKTARVAVFADGESADAAQKANADRVGMEDLMEELKTGVINYDVIIATPKAMPLVGQLGQVLGPRGLMPNASTGTITDDLVTAIGNVKAGQVRFRNDRNGIVHASVGRLGYSAEELKNNLLALCSELRRLKPAAAKGVYLRKISLSSTMGPGMALDMSELDVVVS